MEPDRELLEVLAGVESEASELFVGITLAEVEGHKPNEVSAVRSLALEKSKIASAAYSLASTMQELRERGAYRSAARIRRALLALATRPEDYTEEVDDEGPSHSG